MTEGKKYDQGKAPIARGVLQYFPRAIEAIAQVSAFGAAKYAWDDWEKVPAGVQRYTDGLMRHLLEDFKVGEPTVDAESGYLHAVHHAWGALARLELILREQEEKKQQQLGGPESNKLIKEVEELV